MQNKIVNELRAIERQFQVKIVYACESGSRAWGFPSQTSDYDVRFIYRHPPEWYFSIFEKRDVIEMPLDKVLDINGWDFRKMLRLLYKGNTPLQEWLGSPIVYRASDAVMTALTDLAHKAFRPESAFHHYLSMAQKKKPANSVRNRRTRQNLSLCLAAPLVLPMDYCQWNPTPHAY